MLNRPATFKQADIRRAVAGAQAAGIVVRLEVAAEGRIVIIAAPPGGIPAEIGAFDEAA